MVGWSVIIDSPSFFSSAPLPCPCPCRAVTNQPLKENLVQLLLKDIQTPGQYIGGELNAVEKDLGDVRGRLCLAFPDTYAIGMSHHGLQLLYGLMNQGTEWACERVFCPWIDMEQALRSKRMPLCSLETCTSVGEFDVLGFTLQTDLTYSNVLTMLDLAGIPILAEDRDTGHPLVIGGGPCAGNPEPMSRFIDLFVVGDGEESLPAVCDEWLKLKESGGDRTEMLTEMARRVANVYVPRCYREEHAACGMASAPVPVDSGLPKVIEPAVVADLDVVPLPTKPVVPNVECVQDRIAIEIMRGCPGRCRFCQSTTIKRPLRIRKVETIVAAALESYWNTGYNEISLLSLSTSDYPHFDELMGRLQEVFGPLGVSISVPSLRVNEQLQTVSKLLTTSRRSGLTLAPEAARDEMRKRIGKQVTNHDLFEGCRSAFENGFQRVKLYFMCGLPGETPEDLDGIIEMAEAISRLGKEVSGRMATVVANVSNFVPKPHTPLQFCAMQTREYFRQAHGHLYGQRRLRSVQLKCHDVEGSLLEGVLCRGDRRVGQAIELAWRRGARFDAWSEQFDADLWWTALGDAGVDVDALLHHPRSVEARLPWDHIGIRQGREYLEREHRRSLEVNSG